MKRRKILITVIVAMNQHFKDADLNNTVEKPGQQYLERRKQVCTQLSFVVQYLGNATLCKSCLSILLFVLRPTFTKLVYIVTTG